MMNDRRVAVVKQEGEGYPNVQPFHPPKDYPECPIKDYSRHGNTVYNSVRNALRSIELDQTNYNTSPGTL